MLQFLHILINHYINYFNKITQDSLIFLTKLFNSLYKILELKHKYYNLKKNCSIFRNMDQRKKYFLLFLWLKF